MALTAQGIEAKVRDLADAVVSRNGYELVDLEYRREPAGWTLRLFIDKPGGINHDDCRRVSEELGTVLEVEDPIPHRFNLEVSSPGLDRPLRKDDDFRAAQGKLIRLVAAEPISGQRNFSGRLEGVATSTRGLTLTLVDEAGAEHVIPVDVVKRANLIYEWNAGK